MAEADITNNTTNINKRPERVWSVYVGQVVQVSARFCHSRLVATHCLD